MIEIESPYLTVLISSDYHLSIAVHELFLGFVELPATDAATITESLLENLSQWGSISIDYGGWLLVAPLTLVGNAQVSKQG